MLKKQTNDAFLRKLKHACHWLNIEQGRARTYLRLLEEFDQVSRLTEEHILAYYESYAIVELKELWESRIHRFPGLREKLARSCLKGPVVTEDEKVTASSNRPRNDVFVYLLAGKLLRAGISVTSVDDVRSQYVTMSSPADICFLWNAHYMSVECKRANSLAKLSKRAKDARDQIVASGRSGIVAVDCSVIARPPGTILETDTPEGAEKEISQRLEHEMLPRLVESLSPQVLGLILFARIPAMTRTEILNPDGRAYSRRDCISSYLAVGNRHCPDRTIVHEVAQRLGWQP